MIPGHEILGVYSCGLCDSLVYTMSRTICSFVCVFVGAMPFAVVLYCGGDMIQHMHGLLRCVLRSL